MQIGNSLDMSNEDRSPLAFANVQNEKNILCRVVSAVDQNDTLLAFQPIVKSAKPNSVFWFEGLVRIREASGQINTRVEIHAAGRRKRDRAYHRLPCTCPWLKASARSPEPISFD